MRSRLRLFAVVGILATAIDYGLFLALVGWNRIGADAIALTAAALTSYGLNRNLTFRGSPDARWVRHPGTFGLLAAVAGLWDIAVLLLLHLFSVPDSVAKVVAILFAAAIRWAAYRWVLFTEVRRELAERHDRPPAEGDVRLSIVVPAFREGAAIAATVQRLREELGSVVGPTELEILVVDDGSPDDTATQAEEAGARVISLPENRGKGAAVRRGMIEASGRSVVFTDADLAYPPAMVLPILEQLEQGWDVVVGSRRHEETTTLVRARRVRELGGRVVNWFTHLVLLGHFRDTQCGIKGFRSDVGRSIFERTIIDGFGFDVEVFLIVEQDHFSLTEVPVRVENRQDSSVHIVRDTSRLVRDLFRIRRAAGRGDYHHPPVSAPATPNS